MFVKSLQIGLMGLFLCVASAWAGPASIQGIVKDAKGQPIKNADVRIESRDGKQLFNTAKTDAKGRYISQGLQPGVYRVSLLVNGAVKGSIMNTKTKSDQATLLNFDLRPLPAAQVNAAEKKGKHMVWVPAATGSHMGGRWVEVPDGASQPGALNVQKSERGRIAASSSEHGQSQALEIELSAVNRLVKGRRALQAREAYAARKSVTYLDRLLLRNSKPQFGAWQPTRCMSGEQCPH